MIIVVCINHNLRFLEVPHFETEATDPERDVIPKVVKDISKEHNIFSENLNMTKSVESVTFSNESTYPPNVFHYKCLLCNCRPYIKPVLFLYVEESTPQTCQNSQQETDQMPRLNTCGDHAHKHKTKLDLGGKDDKENTTPKTGVEHIDHKFYTHFWFLFLRGIVGLDH